MVTSTHEGMHRIFQERPEILSPVFGLLGVDLSEKAAISAITTDATETKPLVRHVDTVLRVSPSDGEDFLLAVEAQERKDTKKESSWPYYVAYLQTKYNLPVLLLVVCRDRATTKWASGPFDCAALGWTAQRTHPMVIGPDILPAILDVRTAVEKPALAALSVLAHANSKDINAILDTMSEAFQLMERESATYVYQFLDLTLSKTAAAEKWNNDMTFINYFPGRGHKMERVFEEGHAKGEAKSILTVLAQRNITISDATRERITTCTDLPQLNTWLISSLTATHENDLFTDSAPELGREAE